MDVANYSGVGCNGAVEAIIHNGQRDFFLCMPQTTGRFSARSSLFAVKGESWYQRSFWKLPAPVVLTEGPRSQ